MSGEPVYLHVTIQVQRGKLPEFTEALSHVAHRHYDHGLRFKDAYATVFGRHSSVVTIWEMDDANTFQGVGAFKETDPEYAKWYAVISSLIEDEVINLVRRVELLPVGAAQRPQAAS